MSETERKSGRKRQLVSFPFPSGRSAGSPGKGNLLLIASFWRFGAGSGKGCVSLAAGGQVRVRLFPKRPKIREQRFLLRDQGIF